jgi:hypothetical protein
MLSPSRSSSELRSADARTRAESSAVLSLVTREWAALIVLLRRAQICSTCADGDKAALLDEFVDPVLAELPHPARITPTTPAAKTIKQVRIFNSILPQHPSDRQGDINTCFRPAREWFAAMGRLCLFRVLRLGGLPTRRQPGRPLMAVRGGSLK